MSFFLKNTLIFFFCVYACVLHACLMLAEPEEGLGSPGMGVMDGCEPPR